MLTPKLFKISGISKGEVTLPTAYTVDAQRLLIPFPNSQSTLALTSVGVNQTNFDSSGDYTVVAYLLNGCGGCGIINLFYHIMLRFLYFLMLLRPDPKYIHQK